MRDLPDGCPIVSQAHRTRVVDGVTRIEALRIWPTPAAWAHTPTDGWQPWSPAIHVRWADSPAEDDEYPGADNVGWNLPLQPPLQAIPEHVRAAVAPLDDPACWLALRLLAAVPEALDVVRDIPSLGGLLAQFVEAEDREAACEALRAALRRPRKHLLPLVGLPAHKALLGVLKRLDPKALSIPGPPMVKEVLTSAESQVVKLLHHLPAIRADVVFVLRYPELLRLATFALLADEDYCIGFGVHYFLNRVDAARDRRLVPMTPARFRSRRELLDFDLERRRKECWSPALYSRPFETPTDEVTVLLGVPRVELRPVLTAAQMQEVAVVDRLCIATSVDYPREATTGFGAMYLATWRADGEDHRATVWLSVLFSGSYCLDEVRLRYNRPAPEWLRDRLQPWIDGINAARLEPVEPLARPRLDPQQCLPLRWSASPPDAPSGVEPNSATDRPTDLGYDDWWLVAG